VIPRHLSGKFLKPLRAWDYPNNVVFWGAKVGARWYTTGIEGQLVDDMTNDGKVYI